MRRRSSAWQRKSRADAQRRARRGARGWRPQGRERRGIRIHAGGGRAHPAAVLDLHDLVAAHVARADQVERVPDTKRRGHTDVTLLEHGDAVGARHARRERRLEGLGRLEESKGSNSSFHRDSVRKRRRIRSAEDRSAG